MSSRGTGVARRARGGPRGRGRGTPRKTTPKAQAKEAPEKAKPDEAVDASDYFKVANGSAADETGDSSSKLEEEPQAELESVTNDEAEAMNEETTDKQGDYFARHDEQAEDVEHVEEGGDGVHEDDSGAAEEGGEEEQQEEEGDGEQQEEEGDVVQQEEEGDVVQQEEEGDEEQQEEEGDEEQQEEEGDEEQQEEEGEGDEAELIEDEDGDPEVVEIDDEDDVEITKEESGDKAKKKKASTKEKDTKKSDDKKDTKLKIFQPTLSDFRYDFKSDRYKRTLLIEPMEPEYSTNKNVQEYLANSDRFFFRSVVQKGKHVGHLEIRLKSVELRNRVLKEMPEMYEGTRVHEIHHYEDCTRHKNLAQDDDEDGSQLKNTCIVSVFNLPKGTTYDDLVETFHDPKPNRIMTQPDSKEKDAKHAGYAYLLFKKAEDADEALKKYKEQDIKFNGQAVKLCTLVYNRASIEHKEKEKEKADTKKTGDVKTSPRPRQKNETNRDRNRQAARSNNRNQDRNRGRLDRRGNQRDQGPRRSPPKAINRRERERAGGRAGNQTRGLGYRRDDYGRRGGDRDRGGRRDGGYFNRSPTAGVGLGATAGVLPAAALGAVGAAANPLLGVGAANPLQSSGSDAVNLLVGLSSVLGAIQKQQPAATPSAAPSTQPSSHQTPSIDRRVGGGSLGGGSSGGGGDHRGHHSMSAGLGERSSASSHMTHLADRPSYSSTSGSYGGHANSVSSVSQSSGYKSYGRSDYSPQQTSNSSMGGVGYSQASTYSSQPASRGVADTQHSHSIMGEYDDGGYGYSDERRQSGGLSRPTQGAAGVNYYQSKRPRMDEYY